MDYGWNAINMKRVAHGAISNVIIQNYTNPFYKTLHIKFILNLTKCQ